MKPSSNLSVMVTCKRHHMEAVLGVWGTKELTEDIDGAVREARKEVHLEASLQEGVLNHVVHRRRVHLQTGHTQIKHYLTQFVISLFGGSASIISDADCCLHFGDDSLHVGCSDS